ncbi:MAG: VOC family protein [Alicyclobacillus sp.]|nr:VOC family protein [Alicyclobacillus sp.]
MIHFESVQHVAIVVKDVERAIAFYRDVLGLQPLPRPNFDFPGAWFAVGNQQIHLLTNAEAKTLRGTDRIDSRDGHFALRITDYQEAIAHLEQHGIPYKANPASVTGWAQIFICDPDGNIIELNVPQR